MDPLILIGFAVGVLGFLLISMLFKHVKHQNRILVLVGVVAPSLLVQVFLPEGGGSVYALGWMIAIVLMVALGFSVKRLRKS